MLALLASLRVRLLAAMLLTAGIGLAGAYLLVAGIDRSRELAADRKKAQEVARSIAGLAATGTRQQLEVAQAVLPNDRLLVYRGGRLVFAGPPIARDLELTVTAPFAGGRVVLEDHEAPVSAGLTPLALTGVIAGAVLLVILVALAVTTYLTRALRGPIERAVDAARSVAAGDLSARIGPVAEDEFADLGRTFDQMAARLEESDRDQRRFLADVAHEIATPVNAIRGFAAALADGTVEEPADRAEALELIEGQGARLDGLLADLRALTRLDLAEAVHVDDVDLAELCAGVVARFRRAGEAAGVAVRLGPGAEEPVALRSDRRLLETVLDNLVSNAVRYTPAGGEVTLAIRRGRGEVSVAVRDTGIGIAPEHRRRVFDRLYRVDEARDRASGGSGLGLAIAQSAARSLGGRIELESEPGSGSEFRLVLPRARSGRPPRAYRGR